MQPILPADQLVAFPFKSITDELLGSSDHVTVKQQTAQILLLVCKNREEYDIHIQSPFDKNNVTLYNKPIKDWKLWRLHYWRISTERWLRDKKREDDERNARFIFEANVKLTASKIRINLGVAPQVAEIIATKWIRKGATNLEFVGVSKLFTNVKELQ